MTSVQSLHSKARKAAQTGDFSLLQEILTEVEKSYDKATLWSFHNLYLEATNRTMQANLIAGRKLKSPEPPCFLCPTP